MVVIAVAVFTLLNAARVGRDAAHAKSALLRAEEHLSQRDLDLARKNLVAAQQSLKKMERQLDRFGPILPLGKLVPIVRSQVIAVETFQSAGIMLIEAGLSLADATQHVLESAKGDTPVSAALGEMRRIRASLAEGASKVQSAADDVEDLEGRWLIGSIADARDELLDRLPRYAHQATSTDAGLDALIRFAGGEGPRRYLFLSQNPDEIRPTGGFIGTFGLMTAGPDGLELERFDPIEEFNGAHPDAVVPGAETESPFRFMSPPIPQRLSNVNNVPDFTRAATLARDLWNGSGEAPIDGVVSFLPAFLARILGVLGPVEVEDYGEMVDEANLVERFSYYTALVEEEQITNRVRKDFVASLAEVVMGRLLQASSSRWLSLADAVGDGFTAREAMAWSTDEKVAKVLVERRWDGTLPRTGGDFFYNGEFSFAAKFNRHLQRTFDHHVVMRADGTARITTTVTITNGRERGTFNPGSLSYVTLYGPEEAVLDRAGSDPLVSEEPAVGGHPGAGWFVNAPPFGRVSVRVAWEARNIGQERPGTGRQYSLWWLRVPDHAGDVLNLRIELPDGWKWEGAAPPTTFELSEDLRRTWRIAADD